MSPVTLPVGLPPGTDPESSYVQTVRAAQSTPAIGFLTWTVPSGEVWLPMAILAILGTSAAGGARSPTLSYTDQDSNDIWTQTAFTSYPPNTPAELSGALANVVNPANSVRGAGDYQFSLPWLPLVPRSVITLLNGTGSDVGDRWEGVCQLTVTTWDWTGGSVGSGGTTQEQLGPYLYVPGPEQAVAA